NLELCGEPLKRSCPGDKTIVEPQGQTVDGEDDNSVLYEALYMSLGLGFFAGFWGLLGPILLFQPWRNAYGRFLNRLIDYVLLTVDMNVLHSIYSYITAITLSNIVCFYIRIIHYWIEVGMRCEMYREGERTSLKLETKRDR
ncbi:hypothetical protein CR513_24154, partial [Mucuna pruriens]